jgi:hypothetical protein
VGFRSPRFLHSDHRAVVANIRVGRKGQLKDYRRARQKFLLSLPIGPKDANTTTFDALAAKCVNPKTKRAPGKDWVSEGTWKLIAKRASLLNHIGARKLGCEFAKICTSIWATGTIPQQMCWVVTVLIPKRGGEYWGIGLLEQIWKVVERVMDLRLERIKLHDSLHGCLAGRGMGTGIIEAKLAQQLTHLEQTPFFGVFIDLKKAFDAMDRGRCLTILALHGVGPQMLRLIRNFWEMATNVCRAKGNYGRP